jgi:hypothetical protein
MASQTHVSHPAGRVQSVRGVGSKAGYPYFAWGVYEPTYSPRNRRWTYRLVRSGHWFRSDVHDSRAFEGIPIRRHVRHGSPAPEPRQLDEGAALTVAS